VKSLEVFTFGGSITGFIIETASRTGSAGLTSVSDSVKFEFTDVTPLVGIYGFSEDRFINGLGVIKYDMVCQAEKERNKANGGNPL